MAVIKRTEQKGDGCIIMNICELKEVRVEIVVSE